MLSRKTLLAVSIYAVAAVITSILWLYATPMLEAKFSPILARRSARRGGPRRPHARQDVLDLAMDEGSLRPADGCLLGDLRRGKLQSSSLRSPSASGTAPYCRVRSRPPLRPERRISASRSRSRSIERSDNLRSDQLRHPARPMDDLAGSAGCESSASSLNRAPACTRFRAPSEAPNRP